MSKMYKGSLLLKKRCLISYLATCKLHQDKPFPYQFWLPVNKSIMNTTGKII